MKHCPLPGPFTAVCLAAFWLLGLAPVGAETGGFRVFPYLQNPAPDAMTVVWFSEDPAPGRLSYRTPEGGEQVVASAPVQAEALAYSAWERDTFFAGQAPLPPYRHRVRLSGLRPGAVYSYEVEQGSERFNASFATAPEGDRPIRFIVYADCETEPESTGNRVAWADPRGADPARLYLIDQTQGYANNLEVIRERQPDFVAIAGDLVESGGEQRDWDEFWCHARILAGRVPFLAVPGNHEYYEGPQLGGYSQPGSERAIHRFLTYFEFPANGSPASAQEGRYFRLDYGPVTLIGLDVANDSPSRSARDTNFFLLGEGDPNGGQAPAFGPGSRQYTWLEEQLRQAQVCSHFTFVLLHHVPYSVGPHGWPPGEGEGEDTQSGVPVRALIPLFLRYGVDAVFAGHDELWERSEVPGTEVRPDGSERPYLLQVYDVGTGGDGLRGPEPGLENPFQRFLAHRDAPESWQGARLVKGGKHYGHLEVDVLPLAEGRWQAVLKPVHVFPRLDAAGAYLGCERRLYDDLVTLTEEKAPEVGQEELPVACTLVEPYPNPSNNSVLVRYLLSESAVVRLEIFDLSGQRVCCLVDGLRPAGYHSVEWDGRDEAEQPVSSGVYLIALQVGASSDTTKVAIVR